MQARGRAAGRGSRTALEAAAATSGRSILISGGTVLIAMAGLLLTGDPVSLSLGISTMIVVAAAMPTNDPDSVSAC
jgi:uncharacterized membrane protein YdfJ with MMPL/SSD domain